MIDAPQVRVALPSDEDEVMDLCWALHRENGLFPMSGEKVRDVLRLASGKKGGIVGVIGKPGKIEAAIYLLIATQWYTDEWHLEELFSYCRPEYRKSGNAKALIKFAEQCSIELKLPLTIGVISNIRTKAKIELYKRQLGDPAGAFFVINSRWDETKTRNVIPHNGQQN